MQDSDIVDFAADEVLIAAHVIPLKSPAASGKYRATNVADFGGCYWATRLSRSKTDQFGVQFSGQLGLLKATKYIQKLTDAGFEDRDAGKGKAKATFVRTIDQLRDGKPNSLKIQEAKAALDKIFSPFDVLPVVTKSQPIQGGIVTALRGSAPFFIDLELPPRDDVIVREVTF